MPGTGTPSKGKFGRGKVHIACRRCGKIAYHATHRVCSSCGFGKSSRLRSYSWKKKSQR